MNKPLLAFVTLLVLLFGYTVYQFFVTHEYKEVTRYTSFKGEARENPLFAARLFLKQMGIPTENKKDLQSHWNRYPDIHTTLFLDTDRSTLSPQRTEQLVNWVREGGHLITRTHTDLNLIEYLQEKEENEVEEDEVDQGEEENRQDSNYYSSDPLQKTLEITAFESIYLTYDEDDSTNNDYSYHDKSALLPWTSRIHHLEFYIALEHASKPLRLALNPHFYAINSDHDNESKTHIRGELFLLQRKVGKGLVTLASKLDIFENQLLREADNAEILWHLLHTDNRQPAAVWLIHNDEMPNLFTLMWRYGHTVLLSLGALLLLWLYQSTHRFGPLIPKQNVARRRLLEHIDASGQYFWKRNRQSLLIDSTRQALNQRIQQLHPTWRNADQMGKVDHLAEMLNKPVEPIKRLLFDQNIPHDETFTKLINELESIRKHL